MMNRRRVVAAASLTIGLTATICTKLWFSNHTATPQSVARIGGRLPSLPVIDAAGKTVDLATLGAGGKTVIAFYEPSCHVCQQELPELLPFPAKLRLVMVSESSDHK